MTYVLGYFQKKKIDFLEASVGQYPNQIILSAYNLNMTSGDRKHLEVNIETTYIQGQEFCLYDVACTFQSTDGNTITSKTAFNPIRSSQFPFNRIKLVSVDESGRDIYRYKIKSESERAIDLDETNSFMFGSMLQYQCGRGRKFKLNQTEANILVDQHPTSVLMSDNFLYENINMTCNWDGQWSIPTLSLPGCVCKYNPYDILQGLDKDRRCTLCKQIF